MSAKPDDVARADTDASLLAERNNTDQELGRRVVVANADADDVLELARERADRLLAAARTAADARLPLSEQTAAAVALLLSQRDEEDRTLAAERQQADALLEGERREQREKLDALLVLERQATDLHLALERRSADNAVSSRDDFLAQASHDLRGLMAAQKLYFALLVKEATAIEDRRKFAPHIAALNKLSAQMDRLIGDLVDVVAIEAGRLRVVPRAHSAKELLSTAAGVFEPLAQERGQRLTVALAPADVSVQADAARVVQVLGNLLSNAIKFTPRAGAIRAGFEENAAEVTFFVEDAGPGVPKEAAPHVFERFVGAGGSASGLGLGLYIASQLVIAHGGRLWLDSGSEGGAVFRFTLPRA